MSPRSEEGDWNLARKIQLQGEGSIPGLEIAQLDRGTSKDRANTVRCVLYMYIHTAHRIHDRILFSHTDREGGVFLHGCIQTPPAGGRPGRSARATNRSLRQMGHAGSSSFVRLSAPSAVGKSCTQPRRSGVSQGVYCTTVATVGAHNYMNDL